jgi:hypoxanthine phosphoribosyltransferase
MAKSGSERIEVLFSEEQIKRRVAELGSEITRDYLGRELVLLCVLKGSYVFGADLARAIDLPVRVEFLGVRSYGDRTRSTGAVQITQDLTAPVAGLDLLVVEDIVDTGLTLSFLLDMVRARQPQSLKVCALLHKPSRQVKEVAIDYLGFTVGDVFVVGYGLDHAERYRNLPYVGVVAEKPTGGACVP